MSGYQFSKVVRLFRRFGGIRLVGAYAKLGVLGYAAKSVLSGFLKRTPVDAIYYSYEGKVISALQRRYQGLMKIWLANYERSQEEQINSNIVWFCWLQGINNAPPVVKACLFSVKKNLSGKDIKVIDDNNRRNYVQLPDNIEMRFRKGQIPPAMFSDLLRLELLIKFGGTWIDATVLCTGSHFPDGCLDADLFFFQYAKPDDRVYSGISNWFISSCSHNAILMTLRDMLYAYWEDFNCVVEYFIFHRFFDMLAREKPDAVLQMPYAYSPHSQTLLRHWSEPFNPNKWDKLTSRVSFHKLAHQVADSVKEEHDNYYNYILREFCS